MEGIVEYFKANQEQLVALAVLAGGLVVKLTPTKVDNKWMRKILEFMRIPVPKWFDE